MPSPQYVEQEWKDAGEPGATPIWADIADAGAGPSLQRSEQGIVAAHADALSAHALATAAIPKPGSPATDGVVQYNGATYVTAKIVAANVTDASLTPAKLTPGTNGQVMTVVGGVAAWGTVSGVPLRATLMFHMDSGAEAIPTGWAVCNGQVIAAANHDLGGGDYTMPDFRNRFILGADPTKAVGNAGGTGNTSTDAPGPKGVAGSQSHTISIAELPAHTHSDGTLTVVSHSHGGGSHSHSYSDYYGGTNGVNQAPTPEGWFPFSQNFEMGRNTGSSGVIISAEAPDVTGATGSVGSGTAIDNRPRFYGIVIIMKVKS